MSWGWRKILQVRTIVRKFIWHKVGNGSNTSPWFNNWCPHSPLINTISTRDIHRAGFVLQTKLSDLIHDNTWMWPTEWLHKYPNLSAINVPMLNLDQRDMLV